jgi:quinol monooxygenase YgiN
MWTSLRRVPAFVLTSILLTAMAYAGDGDGRGPSARGPIFDITHFDVIPFNLNTPDSFEQTAYNALFAYRDASLSDAGSKSFRAVNWILAPNHSQIIDVWSSLDAFEAHLAQTHSTDFRFAVQVQPPPLPPGFNCCIGSPIDDRQYSLVKSFNTPWTSNSLAPDSVVGNENLGLFVVTYVDFLTDGDPGKGEDKLVRYGAATSKQSG